MKNYSIKFSADASVEEITDSIADVFGVAYKIEKQLADGFQLTDLLVALQVEPTIREVVNDFPVFVAEFQQLSGATALQAVEGAKQRSLAEFGDLGKVGTFIYDFLIRSARTFNFIESTVVQGIGELNQWKALFASVKKPVE